MRFAKLSTLAVVALSLITTDALAAPVDRKFHPVVNDDPQNAHLNVQTPGADINQTIVIKEEPGPDGQVIPAADAKVASCASKDTNGDIDLSGESSCSPSAASAPSAERQSVTASTNASAPRAASRTVRLPGLASASITQAPNMNASRSAPDHATHAVEAVRVPAPVHENARAAAVPGKRLAPAVRTAPSEFVRMQWLIIGAAAALLLLAVGLGLLARMGLGNLLLVRRRVEDEEPAAQEERAPAVGRDPLASPRGR